MLELQLPKYTYVFIIAFFLSGLGCGVLTKPTVAKESDYLGFVCQGIPKNEHQVCYVQTFADVPYRDVIFFSYHNNIGLRFIGSEIGSISKFSGMQFSSNGKYMMLGFSDGGQFVPSFYETNEFLITGLESSIVPKGDFRGKNIESIQNITDQGIVYYTYSSYSEVHTDCIVLDDEACHSLFYLTK